MEAITHIRFLCPAEDSAQWEIILKGLSEQQWGATLQDRIDYFGTAAAEKLEEMLDEYDPTCWNCEHWSRTTKGFEFQLYSGIEAEEFAESLEELLKLCRATNIEIDVQYDDDDE